MTKINIKNNYLKVFLIGIVTATIIFLPFIIYDKGLFLYYGDFDVQQIPFYSLAHQAIRDGNIFFNLNTDLGVNFIGSYSFYLLGSPFFWLTVPFPNEWVPYLMGPLLILKFGFASLTGYAYIKRFTKTCNIAIIGGILYSFSGFNIYNIFFNHFNEVVVFFPLLLIALEELVKNKRYGIFALSVALLATLNYYFFFGQVIFLIIYFLIRCRCKDFNINIRMFFILCFESIIGVLLSSFLLLPSILAIMGNPRTNDFLLGYDMFIYNNPQRYGLILSSFFFPPDIPARPNFFPDSNAKWSSVSMFLPVVSMTGVFAFLKSKKKHFVKNILIISFFICFIPFLNSAFSAFNYSYYARWFYMPLLFMALATCIAFEKYIKNFSYGIKITGIFILLFAFIGIMPKKVDGALKFFSLPTYPDRFWGYVFIAVVGISITSILVALTVKHKYFYKTAIISICSVIIIYSCFMIFLGKTSGEGYEIVAENGILGAENIKLDDSEFFRIDSYGELDNLGMHLNLPSINAFHSVVPPSVMEFYEFIGGERGVASRPDPKFVGLRGLTSVKYRFEKEHKEDINQPGFEYHSTQNGYKIYENNYFIPMGFFYDKLIDKTLVEGVAKDRVDRLLLKGIYLDDEDYQLYSDSYETLSSELTEYSKLDDDSYFDDATKLKETSASSFIYDNKGFSAIMNTLNDGFAFFSIPYEKGFSATVNGIEKEILKSNGGFMAVEVGTGNQQIRFSYNTPGLKTGFLITFSSIIILGLYMALMEKNRKTLKI